jgi:hypothetical protein
VEFESPNKYSQKAGRGRVPVKKSINPSEKILGEKSMTLRVRYLSNQSGDVKMTTQIFKQNPISPFQVGDKVIQGGDTYIIREDDKGLYAFWLHNPVVHTIRPGDVLKISGKLFKAVSEDPYAEVPAPIHLVEQHFEDDDK